MAGTEKTPMDAAKAFSFLASMFKAIPNDKLEDLKSVEDMWTQADGEHKVPSASEFGTGPAESMRGGNAPRMVGRHSSTEAQEGLTALYERVDGLTAAIGKSFAERDKALGALASVVSDLAKGQKGIADAMSEFSKSATSAVSGVDENSFIGKAVGKITKARAALRKADMADEEDEKEKEQRKSDLLAARDLLKSAQRLLVKAEDDDDGDKDEDKVEKAVADLRTLSDRVSKSLATIVKAEEDEKKKKEEDEAAAKAASVAKAEEDEKKAKEDEEAAKSADTSQAAAEATGAAQSAAAAKAEGDRLDAVLKGMEIMQTNIATVFETLRGISKTGGAVPPSFQVAKAAPVLDVQARYKEALDNGLLDSPADAIHCQTLIHRWGAAEAGKISRDAVLTEIAKSNDTIRQIFAVAA